MVFYLWLEKVDFKSTIKERSKMVKANKNLMTFNGVALSALSIDELREWQMELTGEIIRHNDELKTAKNCGAKFIVAFIENSLEYDTQRLAIVEKEIETKYSLMVV